MNNSQKSTPSGYCCLTGRLLLARRVHWLPPWIHWQKEDRIFEDRWTTNDISTGVIFCASLEVSRVGRTAWRQKPKLFHVLRLCRVGLTTIPIDNLVLYFVLKYVGLLDACDYGTSMTRAKFLDWKVYGYYMANFFEVEAGQSKREVKQREFPEGGAPCSTSGVKFCIGYHVKKHVEPGPHQRRKRG